MNLQSFCCQKLEFLIVVHRLKVSTEWRYDPVIVLTKSYLAKDFI